MRSEKQHEASRLNGTKSRGPVTAEGKRRSSQNARRRCDVLARSFLLQVEDPSQFRDIVLELTEEHQPATRSERRLVETMALSEWKQIRFLSAEKVAIDLQMQIELRSLPVYEHDGAAVLAQAITHMTEEHRTLREINLINSRLNRDHDRALLMLLKLQDRRRFGPGPVPPPVPESCQPEAESDQPAAALEPEPQSPFPGRVSEEAATTVPAASDTPEPEAPRFLGLLADKKSLNEPVTSLKTNASPQVRCTQGPGPEDPSRRPSAPPSHNAAVNASSTGAFFP